MPEAFKSSAIVASGMNIPSLRILPMKLSIRSGTVKRANEPARWARRGAARRRSIAEGTKEVLETVVRICSMMRSGTSCRVKERWVQYGGQPQLPESEGG